MVQAIWNGVVLAESDQCEKIEGNYYFPPDSINREYFKKSQTTSVCPWKGRASYYTLEVAGEENRNAAWYYPSPSQAASNIKGYVAFWNGVKVKKSGSAQTEGGGLLSGLKRLVGM